MHGGLVIPPLTPLEFIDNHQTNGYGSRTYSLIATIPSLYCIASNGFLTSYNSLLTWFSVLSDNL